MPFDRQPTLRGELVGARPLRRSDFDALYRVASDPLIWEQHPASDRHEEAVFRGFFEESLASGGALLVTDLATGDVIGSSRYHAWSEEEREVEIGWTFLARSHWGGRYNGDLKAVMLRHAFRFVDRVVLLIDPTNHRSRRAALKIGAVAAPDLDPQGRMIFHVDRDRAQGADGLTPSAVP